MIELTHMIANIFKHYLRFWAKCYLKRTNPKIVAVTGSVGKTSAKEAIFAVIWEHYGKNVAKAEGNLNTETGVPLAILGFTKSPTKFYDWLPIFVCAPFISFMRPKKEILVLEFAADKPGDIKYLTSIAKPDIAVVTSIGPSHLAAFGQMSKIVEEKISLLWSLPKDGWAVLNIDDENIRKASYGGRWQKMTYGISQPADLIATNIKTEIKNYQAQTIYNINGKINAEINSKTLGGQANVYAGLAAAAVGHILNISDQKIAQGLSKVMSHDHRMQVFEGIKNSTIIDDSYNANPASMKNALTVLKNLKAGRKIAVLGDMREIGLMTDEAHVEIGKIAKETADLVVAVGDLAKKYEAIKHFKSRDKAIDYLLKEVHEGDMILIKASRAIGLDKIVEQLRK